MTDEEKLSASRSDIFPHASASALPVVFLSNNVEVFLRRTGVVMASDTKLLLLTKVKPIIMITINKIIVQ